MELLFISLAPVFTIAYYIYFRDKYEQEPIPILISAFVVGAVAVVPILFVESFINAFANMFIGRTKAFIQAFFVAGLTEEFFKYAGLYLLIWRNRNFNEKFDGVVYAVFVSLGFALVENLMYVFRSGYNVGVMRAFTAVPAHSLFGIVMGYFFGMAKFYPSKRKVYLLLAILLPFVLHGIYDFILMGDFKYTMYYFIPFMIAMLYLGLRLMRMLNVSSVYRNDISNNNGSNILGI